VSWFGEDLVVRFKMSKLSAVSQDSARAGLCGGQVRQLVWLGKDKQEFGSV
jgi:hypothetical protein